MRRNFVAEIVSVALIAGACSLLAMIVGVVIVVVAVIARMW